MPWKECSVMEERLRFVARLLEGEAMTEACREFGISRKTGYKIFDRYKAHGLEALSDRSRRPVRYANQLPAQIEALIVDLKRDKPHWGRPQDPRAPAPAASGRHPHSRQEHDPRRSAPARVGQADWPPAPTRHGDGPVRGGSAQRALVRRL
jgi:transposase-like protein